MKAYGHWIDWSRRFVSSPRLGILPKLNDLCISRAIIGVCGWFWINYGPVDQVVAEDGELGMGSSTD